MAFRSGGCGRYWLSSGNTAECGKWVICPILSLSNKAPMFPKSECLGCAKLWTTRQRAMTFMNVKIFFQSLIFSTSINILYWEMLNLGTYLILLWSWLCCSSLSKMCSWETERFFFFFFKITGNEYGYTSNFKKLSKHANPESSALLKFESTCGHFTFCWNSCMHTATTRWRHWSVLRNCSYF